MVAGLLGFGATAFGLAPNMALDASDLPRQIVTENVTPVDIGSQLELLAEHDLQLFRSDLTRSSDTADSLLLRLNVTDPSAAAFLRTDAVARTVLTGRAGKMVQVSTDAAGDLTELIARYPTANTAQLNTHFTRLRITRDAIGYRTTVETVPLLPQVRLGSGVIQYSLFGATDQAKIPDPVAVQMAEIFAADIDFHTELRRGDRFRVVYEALTADGEPITWNQSVGRVLAAEFVNKNRVHSAVWFQNVDGKGNYFDMDGKSKRRTFLASPMEFSRVTSGFAMRFHPVLRTWRQHKGVDYGAPTGTAVRSVADGVVEFAGWQNGYGNVVTVKHNKERTTLYAHLSRIHVRKGQRVDQGMHVGAVGATGWATGPHLHFEVKVNGQQQNPLTMANASESVALEPAARQEFTRWAQTLQSQLAVADEVAIVGRLSE